MSNTCTLGDIAGVGLGFKSLQNQFFYLTRPRIKQFGIEDQYLKPIFKIDDMVVDKFFQTPSPSQWLFYCNESEKDLAGTGALKYIRAMERVPATERKQTGKRQTISAALKNQGGGYWYAPKAIPHTAHMWLRKAFNTNFSPFIFEKSVALDQRCNFVKPKKGLNWKLVAAVLTSSLFALSVESNGSATMGAGALELATKKLPDVCVPDVRKLTKADREELICLAESVWGKSLPIQWGTGCEASADLRKLDTFLLRLTDTAVSVSQIYSDVDATVNSRILIAKDKKQTTKKHHGVNVAVVANGIAGSVSTLLESKQFPDAFHIADGPGITFDFSSANALDLDCTLILNEAVVDVANAISKEVLLHAQYATPVAQVIAKALLLGRRRFTVPDNPDKANEALANFDAWIRVIVEKIEEGARMSAVGTRYEQQVLDASFDALKLDPRATAPQFYGHAHVR